GGAEAEHRHARMLIDRGAQALQRIGGDQRRVAEDHHDVVDALFDRSACRERCTNTSAFGTIARASSVTASEPGPTTTAQALIPAPRTACSTCASSERPATACSTLGRAERIRVPSPAARTIAKQVRLLILLRASHRDAL